MKNTKKSTSSSARIFIVDDHPLVREWLAELIGQEPDLTVCGEAGSARAALAGIARARPDLAVIDLSLQDAHGTALLKDIASRYPRLPVLVLSSYDETLYAERAIRAGARGYISKNEAGGKVRAAIRQVLQGELVVSKEVAGTFLRKVVRDSSPAATSPLSTLSDRELEVFQLIGTGAGPKQIAGKLALSVKTVESYIARIKSKLHLSSAAELTRYAIEWCRTE
jgi:DNA-binding NarL/FixJ family response regulator